MRQQSGVTLVELMVTIAIAAIMMAVAVPSFVTSFNDNRVRTQADDFMVSLALARSEAINRGSRVTVCKKNSSGNDCNAAGTWNAGWIIFSDTGTLGAVDGTDSIIRVFYGNAQVTITPDANYSNYISYLSNGSGIGSGGSPTDVENDNEIKFCGSTAKDRRILIGPTGRPRVEITSC